jgi:hypothetical protein
VCPCLQNQMFGGKRKLGAYFAEALAYVLPTYISDTVEGGIKLFPLSV